MATRPEKRSVLLFDKQAERGFETGLTFTGDIPVKVNAKKMWCSQLVIRKP